ncbi:MAG: hypothetical protein QM695_02690 [Micropruina sp.]
MTDAAVGAIATSLLPGLARAATRPPLEQVHRRKSLVRFNTALTFTVAASTAAATWGQARGGLRVRRGSGCGTLDNHIRRTRHAVRQQLD